MSKLFTLLILTTCIFFACQQKVILGTNSNNNSNHKVNFESKASDNFFHSKKIKLETLKPTPFISLSAFILNPEYQGEFYYRTMDDNGWSDWTSFQKNSEGSTPGRVVFLGKNLKEKTKQIQFKTNEQPEKPLNIRLFAPGHSKKNANAQIRGTESACSCEQPDICNRGCWCPTGTCPQDATPFPTTPTHVIVHHSGVENTSTDYGASVRSIWNFHANSNGWDDIGYNWLIDPDGIIYEGRGSGLQGAHFSCINGNTTGVCLLGNYEIESPTPEMITALENFVTWEVCDKDIDPLGMEIHDPSTTALNNISGHRDGNGIPNSCSSTVCPGENFYPMLENIRMEVAAKPCLGEDPTNVDKLLKGESISVFPNPNNGRFQIQIQNIDLNHVQIFNSIGQIVLGKSNNLNNSVQELSLSSSGIYFIKFELEDKRIIERKVIVE